MVLWAVVSGANLLFAVLYPDNNKPPSTATTVAIACAALICVVLLALGPRTSNWLLWVFLGVGVASTGWLIYDALTPLGSILFSLAYVLYASYAALWGTRRIALAFLAVMAVSSLWLLVLKDQLPLLLVGWLLLMSICAGLVLLLNHLMSHLQRLATVDPLTGVLNRTGLQVVLDSGLAGGRRSGLGSIVVIDLDNFKATNDELGHIAGDRVLRDFGADVRSVLGADDIGARTGGDEFVLVLPGGSERDAEGIVARLRDRTTTAFSYGTAAWPPGTTVDAAIAAADARMYEDKAAGTEG